MKTFRIIDNLLEEVGTKGQIVYKIVSVQPDGIKILDIADNGVEISRLVKWNQIKR